MELWSSLYSSTSILPKKTETFQENIGSFLLKKVWLIYEIKSLCETCLSSV